MSTIKSISVRNGDMFYIVHNSDNFTQIDCNMPDDLIDDIIDDIRIAQSGKGLSRFISTHPDQDHLCGLKELDDAFGIRNFYCVDNNVQKDDETDDFKHYKKLRDGDKSFYIFKGCSRKWMNQSDDKRGSAGINIHWPDTNSKKFKDALKCADNGDGANNISPVITYALADGIRAMWMGDLEKDFLEEIENEVAWKKQNVLFVPHHGRKSGKVPSNILNKIDPDIIVIGEGPSQHLDYYAGYNTITQNSAKDIWFECSTGWVDVYVSSDTYEVDFLEDRGLFETDRNYIGSLNV